jgi:hypothetical protein
MYVCRERLDENNPHCHKFSVKVSFTQGRQMMDEWAEHDIASEGW